MVIALRTFSSSINNMFGKKIIHTIYHCILLIFLHGYCRSLGRSWWWGYALIELGHKTIVLIRIVAPLSLVPITDKLPITLPYLTRDRPKSSQKGSIRMNILQEYDNSIILKENIRILNPNKFDRIVNIFEYGKLHHLQPVSISNSFNNFISSSFR